MVLDPRTRDRVQKVAIGALAVLLGGAIVTNVWGYLSSRIEARHEEAHPIATALAEESEHTDHDEELTWPPAADESGTALPETTGVVAIERTGDGGIDAGAGDAGPPLPTPPPDAADFVVRQHEANGIYYLEVIVGEAGFDDPLPMIVVLHGRGGHAQIPGGPFLGLTHPVRVIVPQAPDPLGDGWQWLPVYVGQGLVDRLSATLFQTSSRVAALIRTLMRSRPTVGLPIVTGFSQGGLLSLALAVHHDDVVGHAFPLACWLPPPLEPTYRREDLRFPPIRSMHGTADPTIPIGPTRELFERLAALGYDVELEEFEGVVHTISDDENALFHAWLDEAVCRTVDDMVCATNASLTAHSLRGLPPPDAGVVEPDAGPADAGADAGRRRRLPR
jgi:phospholipase/carboxylesterase